MIQRPVHLGVLTASGNNGLIIFTHPNNGFGFMMVYQYEKLWEVVGEVINVYF